VSVNVSVLPQLHEMLGLTLHAIQTYTEEE